MANFQNVDGSYANEQGAPPVLVVTPLTGTTVTMKNSQLDLYVNDGATIAALTVLLPTKPEPGRRCDISTKSIITALTLHDGFGNAITGAPTTLAAGASCLMRYINKTVGWVHWR